jgi:hypothetical protein
VNRRIVTARDVSAGADRVPDGYFDRMLKCIPIEVVGVYVVLTSAAVSAFDGSTLRWWLFVLLLGGVAVAPGYARAALGIRRLSQLGMTTAAFGVFAAATGGWFGTLSWWSGFYPLLASVLFGIGVALVDFGPAHSHPLPAAREPADDSEPGLQPDPGGPDAAEEGADPGGYPGMGGMDPAEESGLLRVWRGPAPPD